MFSSWDFSKLSKMFNKIIHLVWLLLKDKLLKKDSLNKRESSEIYKLDIWKQNRRVLLFSLPVSVNLKKLMLVTTTSQLRSLTTSLY